MDGFNISCANCDCEEYSVEGKSGYGVTIVCSGCGNEEDIFW
jgi:hypothetical protein